jgi:MFS family permease
LTSPAYQTLRHRDFRRLWLALLVSFTGSQMQSAAIDWHVYVLTRSPLALGLVGLSRVIPIVAFSLWGGLVADRYDRRRVLLVTQSFQAIVALGLTVATLAGSKSVALLYAATACSAAASAFDNPARQSLIPRLVPREVLTGALSLNLSSFHLSMICGPALAGVLLAGAGAGHGGLVLIYAVNAVSFLAVIGAVAFMRVSGRVEYVAGQTPPPPLRALREGLRFVFTTPILVWTMALDFFATLFAGAMVLLPIFADQVLGVGALGYGWLRAAPALGALAGSLYTSLRPLSDRQGAVMLWAVSVYGAATIAFGLSRNYVLTFASLALTGLADLVSTVVRQTLRQLVTPDELRGRMTSVSMIFFMGGPQLGELEAGLVAWCFASATLGATVSVVSGGVATLLVTAYIAARAPVIRRYRATAAF